MVLLIGILLIAVVQSIEINSMKTKITGNAVSSTTSNSGNSGLSDYDKMMQEHHGGGGNSQPSSDIPSQVGGC